MPRPADGVHGGYGAMARRAKVRVLKAAVCEAHAIKRNFQGNTPLQVLLTVPKFTQTCGEIWVNWSRALEKCSVDNIRSNMHVTEGTFDIAQIHKRLPLFMCTN